MCKHNLLRAVFVTPPTIPVFLALLRGVEYSFQLLGKEADDVRAAEVRVDIAEEFEFMAEPPTQDAVPEAHLGGQQARGAKVAGRKGPRVVGVERGAPEIQEPAIPPFRPIYPEAEEVAVCEAPTLTLEAYDQQSLRPRDSVILHYSEPLVKNRESQSCLSMGQHPKASFQLFRRDRVDGGAAIPQQIDYLQRAPVPIVSILVPHHAEKQSVIVPPNCGPLLEVRAGLEERPDRAIQIRCYFCVDARPIVNRRDDASIPRAEEIVDVRDRVGGVRSG